MLDSPLKTEYLMSAPVPVRFAGWQSTTFDLQKAGWELSVCEDKLAESANPGLTLAIYHPDMGWSGVSHRMGFDRYEARFFSHEQGYGLRSYLGELCTRGFDMMYVGHDRNLIIRSAEPARAFTKDFWTAIDATPQVTAFTSVKDFAVFAPAMMEAKEVLVMPDTVPQLLDRILELQSPAAQERYEAAAREKRARPRRRAHAQIVTLT